MSTSKAIITKYELLVQKIYFIRGQNITRDRDLAELYGVLTKNLNLAVKRNIERFPIDFMFKLTKEEYDSLRSQFGTLKNEGDPLRLQFVTLMRGQHLKYLPYAFTEQGVAMLSSILTSKQAIAVNIQIIRVFTKMRDIINSNKEILINLEQLERKVGDHSTDIEKIFSVLKKLINPEQEPMEQIGYKTNKK